MVAKLVVGSSSDIANKVASYINSLDSSKTIRAVSISVIGADRMVVLIVHDA